MRGHDPTDPAEAVRSDEDAGGTCRRAWLRDKVPPLRRPDRLLTVAQGFDWPRHCLPLGQRAPHTEDHVCQVLATIRAAGCTLGPATMARLSTAVP
jgi:hypothetical protein